MPTTPKWETTLWSYLSTGDGDHCPLYANCRARKQGALCAEDNRKHLEQLFGLFDCQHFNPDKLNFFTGVSIQTDYFPLLESLADQCLRKAMVSRPPVPLELVSMADDKNAVEVRLVPLKNLNGAVWWFENRWIIHVNANDLPSRQRLTVFHELFHILAHCRSPRNPIFRRRGANGGSFNEFVADQFALHALIPADWLVAKWRDIDDLDEMARIFDVPKSAMWVRCKFLGLV